ncbi:hypothetical protein S40293_09251 [Stachybotrys chartarum IBT 40293]|nr:hypothetical protein S40293_09251 [Stachybotrys chartarum IBT 40293]
METGLQLAMSGKKDEGIHEQDFPIEGDGALVLPGWSRKEEQNARLRLDLTLIPILMAGFFTLQMDRSNLANAMTSTILEDLNITTNQINFASQILLVGIVVLELPSNLLMQKFGPYRLLSSQIVCWSLVATFQAFITNYSELMATRFLLGLFEAGYVPGCLFLLTTWYKRGETSSRVALFYLGQNLAIALSNLIAAAILHLEGVQPLGGGWRWVWFIEGLITIVAAIGVVLFLPRSIDQATPLVSFGKWSYFTTRQQDIITQRLILDDCERAQAKAPLNFKEILRVFKNPRLWMHMFVTATASCAVHGLNIYTPSLIRGFGFTRVQANALASVYGFLGMAFNITLAFLSDRYNMRGPFILLAATWNLINWSCLTTVVSMTNRWHRYVTIILSNVCSTTIPILNIGWLLVHCKTVQERSVSSAMIVIAVNLGGLSGGNILSQDDAPDYSRGIRVMGGIGAATWLLVALLGSWYYWVDRKAGRR